MILLLTLSIELFNTERRSLIVNLETFKGTPVNNNRIFHISVYVFVHKTSILSMKMIFQEKDTKQNFYSS